MVTKKYTFVKINRNEYNNILKYKKSKYCPPNVKYTIRRKFLLFELRNNKLFYENKEVIPIEDVEKVIDLVYNDCNYFGITKLYQLIKTKYFGISKKDVANYLKNNQTNQLHNKPKMQKIVVRPIEVKKPCERLQVDFIELNENDGYRYILNCIDVFSKYVWCYPMENRKMKDYFSFFLDLFRKHNFRIFQADNEFNNKDIQSLCKHFMIKPIFSRPYNPRANGCIERFNKTLKEQINKHFTNNNTKNWIDILPKIVENYNNSYHSVIKMTPKECFYGNKQIIKKASHGIKQQSKRFLKNVKKINKLDDDYKIGDIVRVLNIQKSKLAKSYKQNYSKKTYKIEKINKLKTGIRNFVLDNGNTYFANQIIKVKTNKLIKPLSKKLEVDEFNIYLEDVDENKDDYEFNIYL